MDAIQAYPLQWPAGKPRTRVPERSKFDTTLARARDEVMHQVQMLIGKYKRLTGPHSGVSFVISSNLKLRQDGLPLAAQRQPALRAGACKRVRGPTCW